MEFINQNKQNQKVTEQFVLIFYSIYSINLCIGSVLRGCEIWIPIFMLMELAASWVIFCNQHRNFKVRAVFTTVMIQMTFIIYAVNMKDIAAVIPTFMVLAVLVAFYGFKEPLFICAASAFFVIFYHAVIAGTFGTMEEKTFDRLLLQLGNVLCLGIIIYVWQRKRNESNKQIYQIIEALIDAEQSKDDFLANISHEIRTPVNTICGMSEMALREHEPEKVQKNIFNIRDAGRNLMSLVSDILDFSQLQQGKMDLEEEAYNITSTVNDIINMAMARKGDKPIELIVDCESSIPSGLLGDEKKIRRIIMNLVDNTIKFTNDGGINISLSFRKEDYGVNLCISVKDTGIGISEESMEKLFESFSQVDTRRNRQEGGIGLGLAISKALVLKMGGTITVRSRLGKGSIFRFVIPQKVLEEKPIAKVENREKLNIVAYFDMEQFDMMTIRDEYSELISHMVQQLQVKCHICRNLAELKRRQKREAFTHIFISLEEYQEDEEYFNRLAEYTKVITVIEHSNEKYISSLDVIRLYKPFYILPVVSILNGSIGAEGGRQMVRLGRFTVKNVHALVVDDNLMNIRVIEGMLKEYHIQVTYAVSGQEALEIIENMCYDFVFMDHMMPEMDGIEVLHRIRNKVGHYYQTVPIIVLTANAVPGSREMFLKEGFDDFIAKPVEMSVLERVLKRNLPEEKLDFQMQPKEKKEDKKEFSNERFTIGDLDVEKGLLYCGGKEAYLNILESCCTEGEESRKLLDSLFEQKDWDDYIIKVHALKSTMQNIGAMSLAEKAKALEMAGKKNDIDYIVNNHENMLCEHRQMIEKISQSPPLLKRLSAADVNREEPSPNLPELEEEVFDSLEEELEDAMFSLDGERMLCIISQLEKYQYYHIALKPELVLVRKKIEMSDYMSAADALSQLRKELENEGKGDA